jgi:two-component system, OmpR family, alkaline phosphatase synthesis response regulator PhoP
MAREQILAVEDDEAIMELIAYNLEKANFNVSRAESGEDALRQIAEKKPDLVLLDLMLPEIDGLEVCKRIRAGEARDVPVIMVTANGEESDVVLGLELGADDYVTKPFKPKELVARVRAVLRRTGRAAEPPPSGGTICSQGIEIDPKRREVRFNGVSIDLTFTEFEVLLFLVRHPGWVYTRYQIVDAIRGEGYPVTDRSVDVQIVGLRKKLGAGGTLIETVRGIGYRFHDDA